MVGASKILTVSYGTFSCTLEGFDDPFTAMKAIAEYFRELAADDRYFGAEPPTPDMDMLHRIAEREVQRRVEAQVSEHGVVLRAKADEAPSVHDAPAAPQPATPAEPSDDTDSIAAKLMRIRAVVAASRATAEAARPATADPVPAHALEDDESDLADDFRFGLGLDEDAAEQDTGPDTAQTDGPAADAVTDTAADADTDFGADDVADEVEIAAVDPAEAELADEIAEIATDMAEDEPATEPVDAIADAAGDETAEVITDEIADDSRDGAEYEATEVTADETEEDAADAVDDEVEIEALEAVTDETEDETAVEAVDAAPDEAVDAVVEMEDEPEAGAVEAVTEEVAAEAEFEAVEAIAEEDDDEVEIEAVETVTDETEGETKIEASDAAVDEAVEASAEVDDEPEVEAGEAVSEDVAADAEDEAVHVAVDMAEDEAEIAALDTVDDVAEDEAVHLFAEVEDEPEAMEAIAEQVTDDVAAEAEDPAVEAIAEDAAEGEGENAESAESGVEEEIAEADVKPEAPQGALDLAAWRTDDPVPADIPVYDPDLEDDWTPVSGARARVIKIHRAPAAAMPEAPQSTAAPETDAPQAESQESAPEETAPKEEETDRSAIFAALVDDIDSGSDEEPQNEEFEAEDDSNLLAGIGAAIGRDEVEDEDDLARELAAIAREARRDAHEGRAILESTSGDDDASVERLMEEAKSKLEGVENRRRFSAISHLKAAVAATVADRKLASSHDAHPQEPGEADADMNRYRDDLSKAVRPRRPETDAPASTPRPKTHTAAAPLVLVTEQRVDDAGHRSDEDVVRPRRISADTFMREDEDDFDLDDEAPVSPEDAKSFADFAERLGATGLSELLEAAAAYTATVEGQPHFSRPQILRKVADVAEETDFSREAGLRSFGMLLREGKIQKISRGQFTITGSSKFLAEGKTASR